MADKLKAFLAIAAILMGSVLVINVNLFEGPFWESFLAAGSASVWITRWDHIEQELLGVTLLAAGLTYFWTRSRFHRP